MKKLILFLVIISILLVAPIHAAEPNFRLHTIKLDNTKGVNYSINYPIAIDYDNDGDIDIIYMTKDGELYIFENLLIGG